MLLSVLLTTEDTITHIGSGFVANKKGLFITAAHVIINHLHETNRLRVSVPDSETPSRLFKISILHYQYLDPTLPRNGPNKKSYHQDLAICRVLSYNLSSHFKLRLQRPLPDEILRITGFYNPDKISVPIINNTANLSFLVKEDTQFRIKHRLFSIFSRNNNDYEQNPELVSNEKIFNNCLTLRNSAHQGVSGGPVLNSSNKVVGIFLGGNQSLHYSNILCSKYIRKSYRFIK